MERYDSYKDSGVDWIGEIPIHWGFEKTRYTCGNEKKTVQVSDFEGQNVIHYSIPNVQEFGKGIVENGEEIDSSKLLLSGGEILVSKLNPRKGCVTKVESSSELMILGSGEFIPLVPKSGLHADFLFNFVQSPRYSEYLDSNVESVTRSHQRVSPDIVYDLRIPIPPLHEQEQIVEYLDRKTTLIDSLIEKTVRKIELLKEKRTSLINEVVTKGLNPDVEMKDSGVEWIGEIPSHWSILRNKYFTTQRKDKSETGEEDLLSVSEHHGVVPRRVIRDGEEHLSRSDSFEGYLKVSPGELVSNIMLMWKTGLGVSEYEGLVSPAYSVFRFTHGSPKYFHYLFRTSQYTSEYRRNSTGVIESRLRLYDDSFGRLPSHSPPLHEQEQIVEYLDEQTSIIDSTITTEEKRIELLKEYRQSLISEVVTGKVKVTRDE